MVDAGQGFVAEQVAKLGSVVGLALEPVDVQAPGLVLPGPFRVDVAAAAVVGAATSAIGAVCYERTGHYPKVLIDSRAAQVAFRSERYLRRDGRSVGELWAPLSGDYRCVDGWLKVHANFAHHGDAAAVALGVPAQREAIAARLSTLPALTAEEAVIEAGGVAAALRHAASWRAHAQGRIEAATAPVRLRRLGERGLRRASPRPWPDASLDPLAPGGARRPLAGLRVLELARVLAGPVCGRVLAAHGADVLTIAAGHLPQIEPLMLDTGFGKRSALLDLRVASDRAAFEELLTEADVLVQSYRPGALGKLGYDTAALAAHSPGLVVLDVQAYSSGGPWSARRGFDSLVQMVSGLAAEAGGEAGMAEPVPLRCQALDHGSGWLAALAAVAGIIRQRQEGGCWHAEISLAATACWLDGLGRLEGPGLTDPGLAEVAPFLVDTIGFGPNGTEVALRHVAMPGTLDGATVRWDSPPPRLGSSPPSWRRG